MRQLLLVLVAAVALTGCKKETQSSRPSPVIDSGKSAKSTVPLRVWFASEEGSQELSNRALIQRQWQAASERPLELRMLDSLALLDSDHCECDVVIFPAHLIGDLSDRQWLVALPSSLTPATLSAASSSADSPPASGPSTATAPSNSQSGDLSAKEPGSSSGDRGPALQPAAWIDQTRYGRSLWGLSLGATMPVVMSNFEWALPGTEGDARQVAPDAKAFWQAAIEALSEETSAEEHDHPPLADPDPNAVCDRFLIVLTSISRRESRFGSLLHPETLKARLSEPEFVAAAKIMLQLHKLNAAPEALLGSYQTAWQSLADQGPCLSIGVPPLPTPDVDKVTSIAINLPPLSPGLSGARSTMSDRTMGWNSGHGLMASLTAQCRQTGLAIEFMRWLSGESNRNALARSVQGVSGSSLYAPGSSAWQAQRLGGRIAQQSRLPNEPRLPGSAQYRRTLGEHMVRMLNGEAEPEAALAAAAAAWDEISASRNSQALRASYEASLGL